MKHGTTAFSFTNEWLARGLTLEQLLERVAALGLGPGIELIGFQAWRSFPHLERKDVLAFRRLVDRLGLEPAALGAYADLARRADLPMSVDEAVGFLRPQLDAARALGFPLVRLHAGVATAVLERLAPVAEAAGLTLAIELQGSQTPEDPAVASVLDVRERLGSPALALALDFSVAMTDVPAAFADAVRRAGTAPADLEALVALWHDGASTPELLAAIAATAAPAAALDEARSGFVRFGRQEPESWLPLVPCVAHAHAKFWQADEDGSDPTVRTAELLATLRAGGFDGFVVAEWGGNAWDGLDVDAFSLVSRHRSFCLTLSSTRALEVPAHP